MKPAMLFRLLMLAALAAAIAWAAVNREALDPAALESTLRGFGVWAPVVFMALFALATLAFLPGVIFSLAGGALFGPVLGTLYNLTGATVGAILAFLAARYLAAGWVRSKAGPRLGPLIEGVEAEGWRFVAVVRLVPLFPFNVVNYAFGLTRLRLFDYTVATFVCMAPGAIAYTYLGYAGREAISGGEGAVQKGLLALGLLALVAFLPGLIKRWRRPRSIGVAELHHRLEAGGDVLVLDVRGTADFHGAPGHVPQAVNIPLSALPRRLSELRAHRQRSLAVMCFTDKKSKAALRLLKGEGFVQAMLVEGGVKEWNRLGLPVEHSKEIES